MSDLRANPFHTVRGWYWEDEDDKYHGPFPTQLLALRGLLEHCDPQPSMWQRFFDYLLSRFSPQRG